MPLITVNKIQRSHTAEADDQRFYRRMFGVLLLACLSYAFAVTFLHVPQDNQRYADYILGSLIGAAFMALVTWRWGGSHSAPGVIPPAQRVDIQHPNEVEAIRTRDPGNIPDRGVPAVGSDAAPVTTPQGYDITGKNAQ